MFGRLIKIYSHPRSGTHFLEAFLARNFYPEKDLAVAHIPWGHWSNRKVYESGGKYKKLFGSHYWPDEIGKRKKHPMVYIYRDGRAVAYSIWKTENFLHKDLEGISFSDFLRIKLDWKGGPGKQADTGWNIAEHWYHHVHAWTNLEKPNLIKVRYEDLQNDPNLIYSKILKKFYPIKYNWQHTLGRAKVVDPIKQPTGLKPNKAKADTWKTVFTEEDHTFFLSQLPNKAYLYFK